MLINTSKPVGAWIVSGSMTSSDIVSSVEEGNLADQILLVALLCIGLLILVKRRFSLSVAIRENPWLMLLLGYMFVSIFWSDIPFVSFKRWTREFIVLVMSFVIATEPEPRRAIKSIIVRMIYILIPLSYVLIRYFPAYGRQYNRWDGTVMWIGAATQKNGLGVLCVFAVFFLIWSFMERRKGSGIPVSRYHACLEAIVLFLALYLMGGPGHNLSYSATSNAALLLGVSTYIGISWFRNKGVLIGPFALTVIVALIAAYGTVTPFLGKLSLVDVSSVFQRDSTLTGRNDLWAILVPLQMQRPLWGYGFGGFWNTAIIQHADANEAHNGYLDLLLNIGFVGYIFFIIVLLSFCRTAQRMIIDNFDWGILFVCFLLMAVVHNISESTCVVFTGKMLVPVLILSVSSNYRSLKQ